MLRNLALEFVQVTEAAAIAAARWAGRGDRHAADQAAVDAMRQKFSTIDFHGEVVIGEGKRDQAPELYVGEELGAQGTGPALDIAVDPLDGTTPTAEGKYNSLSVVAVGPRGTLLSAPDIYMQKIAVGPTARDVIDPEAPVKDNVIRAARALGKEPGEFTVVALKRDRHKQLIQEIRSAGARVMLIDDGDIEPPIAACLPERGVDMYMGIGKSAEGVLAATAIKMLGGQFYGRLKPKTDQDREEMRLKELDAERIYTAEDLARGEELSFVATGVLDGSLLSGVVFGHDRVTTNSIIIRSATGTVRYLTTNYYEDLGHEKGVHYE